MRKGFLNRGVRIIIGIAQSYILVKNFIKKCIEILFVSEPEIAERLRNRGEQFINIRNLIIACRHLEQNRDISDISR